jgi:hypothetical protein
MTPPGLTPARRAALAALLGGLALGTASVAMTGRSSVRVGADETTRFTRGLWFSPWYEEVERRTPAAVESRSEVRVLSWSWAGLAVAVTCGVTLVRLTAWPGVWLRGRRP